MKKLLFSILCLCLIKLSFAGSISGSLDAFYANEKVVLYIYEEGFSGEKTFIGISDITNGEFSINYTIQSTTVAVLESKRVSATIFLDPITEYTVFFPRLEQDQFFSFNNTTTVDLVFTNLAQTDINNLISTFNWALDDILRTNLDNALEAAFKSKLRSFSNVWKQKAQETNNAFFKSYVHYAIANVAYHTSVSEKELIDNYLSLPLINFKNPEFADFILTVFDNEVVNFDLYSPGSSLKDIINKNEPADVFIKKLSANDFLKSPKMVELVGAIGLSEVLNNDIYTRENVLKLIKGIGKLSVYADVKTLCNQLYHAATKYDKGSPTGDLQTQTLDGKTWTNKDLTNKPTIIVCWATWSRNSIKELLNFKDLYKQFQNQYNFIALNLDFDTEAAKAIEIPSFFTSLSYRARPQMLEQLGIITCPHNILINKLGQFEMYQAPVVNAGLKVYMTRLLK